ncbi:MAG TPA: hypothetical protein VJ548_08725 [Azospira sp.]|nr:hypothetical protein [Azospira sp.]
MSRSVIISCLLFSLCLGSAPVVAGPPGRPSPPIVLRLGGISVAQTGMPSPGSSNANTATEVFWLSVTALLTFGAPLLDLPNVLERGDANARNARLCAESWERVRHGDASWLKSEDLQGEVLESIRDEVITQLGNHEPAVTVEIAAGGTGLAQRAKAIREIAIRLAAPALILADVRVGIEPGLECTVRFSSNADMSLEETERPGAGGSPEVARPFATVSGSSNADVHQWAAEPEVGRRALRQALLQLAREIARAYAREASIQDQATPSTFARSTGP